MSHGGPVIATPTVVGIARTLGATPWGDAALSTPLVASPPPRLPFRSVPPAPLQQARLRNTALDLRARLGQLAPLLAAPRPRRSSSWDQSDRALLHSSQALGWVYGGIEPTGPHSLHAGVAPMTRSPQCPAGAELAGQRGVFLPTTTTQYGQKPQDPRRVILEGQGWRREADSCALEAAAFAGEYTSPWNGTLGGRTRDGTDRRSVARRYPRSSLLRLVSRAFGRGLAYGGHRRRCFLAQPTRAHKSPGLDQRRPRDARAEYLPWITLSVLPSHPRVWITQPQGLEILHVQDLRHNDL
ncbi:hypothetical protein B0H14DRAFT_3462965 [Mycena olivaceomarginata]|nr:hypothetical protein B0H14DRAFT_3462965 [Mycena olivaceomarginata]